MKIMHSSGPVGIGVRRAPKPASKPVRRASSAVLEVDLDPDLPPKKRIKSTTAAALTKVERLQKLADAEENRSEDDELEDDDDDDSAPPPLPKRSQALELAPALGIQDFEVERAVRPERPERISEEVDETGKEDWAAVRKNNKAVAVPSRLPGNSSKDRVRGIVTMFGQRADVILSLLEHDDRTDGALTLIQRTLLQTMVDILPVIERGVRRSHGHKGVIPLNQTVSQIRELVTDIQSLRDRGHLGASIVERVLRPAFLDIGVQIALAFNNLEGSAKNKMSKEDGAAFIEELTSTKMAIAQYMTQQYEEVKSGVSSSLS